MLHEVTQFSSNHQQLKQNYKRIHESKDSKTMLLFTKFHSLSSLDTKFHSLSSLDTKFHSLSSLDTKFHSLSSQEGILFP